MSSETTSTVQTFSTVLSYKIILWGVERCVLQFTYIILIFLCLKLVHVFTSWKQKYTRLLKSSIDVSCISYFYRFTVMDTSFHASENDFIWEDCGKCLNSRSGLRRHRLRQHLKQEIKFKYTRIFLFSWSKYMY
jgi:hypothetical protein